MCLEQFFLLSCNDGESREMKVRLGWVDEEVHTYTNPHLHPFMFTQIHPQLGDKSASAGYWLVYSYFTYKPTFTNSHSDSDLMIIVMANDHPLPLLNPCTQLLFELLRQIGRKKKYRKGDFPGDSGMHRPEMASLDFRNENFINGGFGNFVNWPISSKHQL